MKDLKSVFILALVFVLMGSTVIMAQDLSSLRNLIVGGGTVPKDVSYKWFVRFGGTKHLSYVPSICGGVLISPEFVLTSARCLPLIDVGEELMIGARCGGVAEDIGGENCGEYYEMRSIKKKVISPHFVNKAPFFHDLAIVQLNETSTIEPVIIDDGSYSSQYKEGKQLWVIGFGAKEILQNKDTIFPYELEHAEVKYGDQGKCFQAWEEIRPNSEKLDNSMICAGSLESSACLFDTGGPLYDLENNVLVGIARWEDVKCSFQFGSIFSRLSTEFEKIQFKVCQLSKSPKPNICNNSPSTPVSPPFYTNPPTHKASIPPATNILPSNPPTSLSCSTEEMYVVLEILTDKYPQDNTVEIKSLANDETIFEFETFTKMEQLYTFNVCAKCGLYQMSIYDSYQDGILDPGYYSITVDGRNVISGGKVTGKKANQSFGDSRCTSDEPSHNLSGSPSISPSFIPTAESTIPPTINSSTSPSENPTLVSCPVEEMFLTLEIMTDAYPEDTSVKIIDILTNETLMEKESFGVLQRYIFSKCVPCGLLKLSITDFYGDGIKNGGYYSLTVDREVVVSRESVLGNGISKIFGYKCRTLTPSSELSSSPSINPTIDGGLSKLSMTFHQTFESNSPIAKDRSSALLFEETMENYTSDFAGIDQKVQTNCSVIDAVFSESFTLALVKYEMTFTSLYHDVMTYGEKFKDYVNNNLDRLANDLQALDIIKALLVFEITDSPTTSPTEPTPTASPTIKNTKSPSVDNFVHVSNATYYQEFRAVSVFDNAGQILFEERIEYYAKFLFFNESSFSKNQFRTFCDFVDQVYVESQELLNIKYTIQFESTQEISSSNHNYFRDFINANLPKLADDLSTVGIREAKPVYIRENTASPTVSPNKPSSPPCSEGNIQAELSIFTDDKADKISVEVRNISQNDVIQKITDFSKVSEKVIDFCLPCNRYFLSILVSSGEKTGTTFHLTIDEKVLVKDGMVYGFGTAVVIYSEKCS